MKHWHFENTGWIAKGDTRQCEVQYDVNVWEDEVDNGLGGTIPGLQEIEIKFLHGDKPTLDRLKESADPYDLHLAEGGTLSFRFAHNRAEAVDRIKWKLPT